MKIRISVFVLIPRTRIGVGVVSFYQRVNRYVWFHHFYIGHVTPPTYMAIVFPAI